MAAEATTRNPRHNNAASWRRILRLLRPYRARLVAASVLLVATGGLSLIFPLVIRGLLDTILVQRNGRLLNTVALALLAVFALQMLLGSVQGYLVTSIGERFTVDLRVALFRHLQWLPISFFDQRRTGELMSRVTNDVTVLQTSLTGNILPVVSQVLTLVGSIAIAVTLNWRISLVVLAVVPPAGFLSSILGRRIRRTTRGVQEGLGNAGIVLEETLGAPRVVKAFGREAYEEGRFTDQIGESLRQALRRAATQSVIGPLIGFISFVSVVIVLWFGGREVLAGRLTAGALIAFIIYLVLAVGPLVSLTGLYSQLQAALAAGERVFALLDEPVEVGIELPDAPAMPPIHGRVAFEHVSFAYPILVTGEGALVSRGGSADSDGLARVGSRGELQRQVLRDVTFEAQTGQVVALVGPSGAGKTTTLSLLLRFYELDSGAMSIDGVDIRSVRVESLREQIAIVPQEPTLFGGSIAENIRYGRLDASDEEVRAAAEVANVLSFAEQLPEGMGTLVGERGVKLSAGQRQRIAIARAVLRNPRILLLDEATASLDNASEALVQEALNRLMQGRTTLVVAHRLTTVERADMILVLDGGQIVERGTHAELLGLGGLYARLYTRNFEDVEERVAAV